MKPKLVLLTVNKIGKTFRLTKKKRKRYQLPKSGMKEEASLLTLQNNYEKVYATKLDNLDEIDKFLGRHKLAKQIREETENLNRLIT